MTISQGSEWIEMSQRERDRLKVLYGVCKGERLQKEAARLLRLSRRQVRRLVRRIEESGHQGLIHRLRGRTSNRALPAELRQKVLAEYQSKYPDFGPTLAAEKLAAQGLKVSPTRCDVSCRRRAFGSGDVSVTSTGNGASGVSASANWCRWTVRFTSGWRLVASRWCRRP